VVLSAGSLINGAGWFGARLCLHSIPIVGEGVALYSWGRFWGELGYDHPISMWFNDVK